MDVSSKYFSLLSSPSPYPIRYVWRFLLDIHRVGKLRELISFMLWEINHHLRIYHFGNQYVKFTADPGFAITNERASLPVDVITSSFLTDQGLCFQPVSVDWKYCALTTDGVLWGCCYANLNALYYSDDQSQSAVLVHEFAHPITSLFISQQNSLFICSNGVVYKSGVVLKK